MNGLAVEELLTSARRLASAGEFAQAAPLYHQVLLADPRRADVHTELGASLHQMGRLDEAITFYRRAIDLQPKLDIAYFNLSVALLGQNKVGESIDVLRRALSLAPQRADGWNDLGTLLRSQQKLDEAIGAYRQAITVDPRFLIAWLNLATLLHDLRRLAEAAAAYRQALAIDASRAEIWEGLSRALLDENRTSEAIEAARHMVALEPTAADFHNGLGLALLQDMQLDAASSSFRRALALNPGLTDAKVNISAALLAEGRLQDVLSACSQILADEPNSSGAHCNRGVSLLRLGRTEEAIVSYRRASALEPESPVIHYNLGQALIRTGQFEEGWKEYEWRKQCMEIPMRRGFREPEWDGSNLRGRRILLHMEQGFGDAIQFVRYIPQVLERSPSETILWCPPELVRLFQGLGPRVRIVSFAETKPVFDVQAPLMSLPHLLHSTLKTIPNEVPYLRANTDLADQWRGRISERIKSGLRVGLAWAGRPEHTDDRNRSIVLSALAPLAQVPNVTWISLQKGKGAEQLKTNSPPFNLHDFTSELTDFFDTAALVECLDLVISVDTATAHLAGAMGKPVWVLLPYASDWRWMLNRNDSPWYPTMRLFRQPKPGDWESVARQVVDGLNNRDWERQSSRPPSSTIDRK